MTRKFTIAGKVYDVPANQNHEISDTNGVIPQEVIDYCKAAPRVKISSHGKPIIKDDAGIHHTLGCKSVRIEGEKACDTSKAGPAVPDWFWAEAAKIITEFSDESQKLIATNCPEVAAKVKKAAEFGLSLEEYEDVVGKALAAAQAKKAKKA